MEHVIWVVYCPRTIVQPIRPALITTQDVMMGCIMRPVHHLTKRPNYLLRPHRPSLKLLLHHQLQPHPQPLLRIARDCPLIVWLIPSRGRRRQSLKECQKGENSKTSKTTHLRRRRRPQVLEREMNLLYLREAAALIQGGPQASQ